MKKKLALLLIVSMMGTLFGCSPDKASKKEETQNETIKEEEEVNGNEGNRPYEGTTLTIMLDGGDSGSQMQMEAFDKCAEIMGVEVKYDVYPSDQYLSVVNTKLATGNGGDLLWGNKGIQMLYSDALVPLEGEWIKKMSDITKMFCMDDKGNYLAAPVGPENNMGLLYNEKVLKDSGVTLPIADYNDFVEACKKIKEAGYTPLYVSNKEQWTAQILLLCSMTPIFDKNPDYIEQLTNNKIKPYDIPELKELFERVVAFRDEGLINEDYMSATNDMGLQSVANGECAFYAVLDSAYGTLVKDYPKEVEQLGLTTCPMWVDQDYAMIMNNKSIGYLYVVDGPNVEAAKEFINTMLQEESFSYLYHLIPGKAPYEGLDFEVEMNDFGEEMVALHEETEIPYYAQWNDAIYEPYNSDIMTNFYGDFAKCIQDLFAGMSVDDVMEQWYNNYAADAKALRLKGWE